MIPSASFNRSSGSSYSSVIITAIGLAPNENVAVTWDGGSTVEATGRTDGNGTVSLSIRTPHVNGVHTAAVRGATSGLSGKANYLVIQNLKATPAGGSTGDSIKVSGTGWQASQTLSIYWNRTASNDGTKVCSAKTGYTGSFSCTFKVPSSLATGTVVLMAGGGSLTASAPFKLTGASPQGVDSNPAITISRSTVRPTMSLTVSGSGFLPDEQVSLAFDDANSKPVGSVTADASGDFQAVVTIPSITEETISFSPTEISTRRLPPISRSRHEPSSTIRPVGPIRW